jgi:hypothetical protein
MLCLISGIFRSEMLIYLLWFHQFHFRCESRALKHWSEVNQRWGTTGYTLGETDPLLAGTRCPDELREPDSTRMGWTHSGVEWPVQYIKR